uniref:Transmembrane protease serine 9-like protein n=1 Tax=Rhipicephalus zambeziensis TaxID=60191 RepID=A0A224YQM4_9ACAR
MNILGAETILAGWGRLIEGGVGPQRHLRYTTVKVVPNERCMDKYTWRYNSDVMYCAYRSGTDSCKGDSGGPAVFRVNGGRYLQVGIVSFARGCARAEVPAVYTRVDAFTPWIKQVVSTSVMAYTSEVPLQPPFYTVPQWPLIFQFP